MTRWIFSDKTDAKLAEIRRERGEIYGMILQGFEIPIAGHGTVKLKPSCFFYVIQRIFTTKNTKSEMPVLRGCLFEKPELPGDQMEPF